MKFGSLTVICMTMNGPRTQAYNFGTMETRAKNEKQAFTRYLANKHGITFKRNRTRIEFDGDCYTIIDRKTKEPLFIAIPLY